MKWLHVLPFALLLLGCEGATTMTHTFSNRTEDTLDLTVHLRDLPWYDSVQVLLMPNEATMFYTADQRGKCNNCGHYMAATPWVDTLILSGAAWSIYPVPGDWLSDVREGRSWIQFDHTLHIEVGMVE